MARGSAGLGAGQGDGRAPRPFSAAHETPQARTFRLDTSPSSAALRADICERAGRGGGAGAAQGRRGQMRERVGKSATVASSVFPDGHAAHKRTHAAEATPQHKVRQTDTIAAHTCWDAIDGGKPKTQ